MRMRAIILAAALLAAPAGADVRVTTIDGRQVEGQLVAIGGGQVTVRLKQGQVKVAQADVRAIAFDTEPVPDVMARPGQHVLLAEDDSRLALRDVTIAEGRLKAVAGFGEAISVPLEAVARLLRPLAHERPAALAEQLRKLSPQRSRSDTFIVGRTADERAAVHGVLAGLAGGQLRLSYEGSDAAMDAATVAVIEMAKLAERPAPRSAGVLVCTDGSRVALTSVSFDGKAAAVESPSLGRLTVPAARIARVEFRAGRLTCLGDLAPSRVRQTPFFDEQFPYRKDRSAMGGPLRLGGATYDKGLGLHARCQLDFDLRGAYRYFSAVAGIDDDARAGAAELTILADGKAVLDKLKLDRTRPPQPVRLDVAGVRTMTILVDFAANTFGSGARVDLCDAALSK